MRLVEESDKAIVHLTRGLVAIIDIEDAPKVSPWKWHAKADTRRGQGPDRKARYYAVRTSRAGGKRHDIYLHVAIHGEPSKGMIVDHRDGDTLNDRRGNLEEITKTDNRRKSTATLAKLARGGRKCVYFSKREQKYYAILHLGSFDSEDEAELEYLRAANAVLNAKKAAPSN